MSLKTVPQKLSVVSLYRPPLEIKKKRQPRELLSCGAAWDLELDLFSPLLSPLPASCGSFGSPFTVGLVSILASSGGRLNGMMGVKPQHSVWQVAGPQLFVPFFLYCGEVSEGLENGGF